MIDDEAIEGVFDSLDALDPLDADALYPRAIRQVRSRWSPDDRHHLDRLLTRLQKSFECQPGPPGDFRHVASEITSSDVKFLCLEAVSRVDPFPERVHPAVRLCLGERDFSLRGKALKYVRRTRDVDASTASCVKAIIRDRKASIGNRLSACWVLWKLRRKGKRVTRNENERACRT